MECLECSFARIFKHTGCASSRRIRPDDRERRLLLVTNHETIPPSCYISLIFIPFSCSPIYLSGSDLHPQLPAAPAFTYVTCYPRYAPLNFILHHLKQSTLILKYTCHSWKKKAEKQFFATSQPHSQTLIRGGASHAKMIAKTGKRTSDVD